MPELGTADGSAQPLPMPGVLPRGTLLRGYEVTSVLGKGGFGITYRAVDANLHRDVAIKEYLPTSLAMREGRTTVLPHSPDHAEQFAWGRERFLDEARTLARLDCPAVVRVYDFLEDNGTAYLVMALVEGETLNKRLMREQRLIGEAIERLIFPLLDGLEGVHAIGFLHRDIKPANIMVDDQGRPTLIDFGASRAAMIGRSTTMTAVFTPGYAAPEQFITAGKLGPWSDIYGVAATLYHAITGRIPPSGIDRIVDDTYEPLSDLRPEGFAPELLAGIDAGMAVRAADRPQSIPEWRQVLRSHSAAMEMTRINRKPGPLARATTKARRSFKGPVVSGWVAAGLMLLAGGGYLAFTANAPPSGGGATLNLSTEQLEQVLAERRKADALVVEKRRLEEDARQKAETDAETKRQADQQLAQARQALQKAEQELATIKADIEARRQPASGQADQAGAAERRAEEEATQRKAETETATLRDAEQEAVKRAEAEAEAKRQADLALAVAEAQRKQAEVQALARAETEAAARRQASEEAQLKAEAEAASRRLADEAQARAQAEREKVDAEAKIKADAKAEADKAAATLAKLKAEGEAAERGLRLEQPDRQRLQVALTSLGFDTRGSDGVFGPRSREMIAGWQQKAGAPATGFVSAAQRDQLLSSAAPAVTRWDDEQKKAEEEAKVKATPAAAPAPGAPSTSVYNGTYSGLATAPGISVTSRTSVSLQVTNGRGSGAIEAPGCSPSQFSVQISPTGSVSGEGYLNCVFGSGVDTMAAGPLTVSGAYRDGRFELSLGNNRSSFKATLNRGSAAASLSSAGAFDAKTAIAAAPVGPFDGTYSGILPLSGNHAGIRPINLRVAGGSGSGTIEIPTCGSAPFSVTISSAGDVSGRGEGFAHCSIGGSGTGGGGAASGPITIKGRAEGGRFQLELSTASSIVRVILTSGKAVAAPALTTPDGLWRGTYVCGLGWGRMAGVAKSSGSPNMQPAFSLNLEMRLTNGSASMSGLLPTNFNGGTHKIHVSVNPTGGVEVTRFIGNSTVTLTGQFEGHSIRANGKESDGTNRDCTLALTR